MSLETVVSSLGDMRGLPATLEPASAVFLARSVSLAAGVLVLTFIVLVLKLVALGSLYTWRWVSAAWSWPSYDEGAVPQQLAASCRPNSWGGWRRAAAAGGSNAGPTAGAAGAVPQQLAASCRPNSWGGWRRAAAAGGSNAAQDAAQQGAPDKIDEQNALEAQDAALGSRLTETPTAATPELLSTPSNASPLLGSTTPPIDASCECVTPDTPAVASYLAGDVTPAGDDTGIIPASGDNASVTDIQMKTVSAKKALQPQKRAAATPAVTAPSPDTPSVSGDINKYRAMMAPVLVPHSPRADTLQGPAHPAAGGPKAAGPGSHPYNRATWGSYSDGGDSRRTSNIPINISTSSSSEFVRAPSAASPAASARLLQEVVPPSPKVCSWQQQRQQLKRDQKQRKQQVRQQLQQERAVRQHIKQVKEQKEAEKAARSAVGLSGCSVPRYWWVTAGVATQVKPPPAPAPRRAVLPGRRSTQPRPAVIAKHSSSRAWAPKVPTAPSSEAVQMVGSHLQQEDWPTLGSQQQQRRQQHQPREKNQKRVPESVAPASMVPPLPLEAPGVALGGGQAEGVYQEEVTVQEGVATQEEVEGEAVEQEVEEQYQFEQEEGSQEEESMQSEGVDGEVAAHQDEWEQEEWEQEEWGQDEAAEQEEVGQEEAAEQCEVEQEWEQEECGQEEAAEQCEVEQEAAEQQEGARWPTMSPEQRQLLGELEYMERVGLMTHREQHTLNVLDQLRQQVDTPDAGVGLGQQDLWDLDSCEADLTEEVSEEWGTEDSPTSSSMSSSSRNSSSVDLPAFTKLWASEEELVADLNAGFLSTASVAALRLRGGHAEWLVAQKSGMPGVYCLRVEVLEGLQGLTLEGYLGGCGYVMEEAQKLSALLVAQEQWDLLEIPVEVRKAAKLASQRANEADQNKNQKGQEQKQQQEDHQMNVTTISPAGTPGSALQEEQMMQQQEGNQGAANITTSTDSISSSSAVITSSSNAGSTQEVEDQWLTAALNDVMPSVPLLATLLQRAEAAAARGADSGKLDCFWPGLQATVEGLPGLNLAGIGYACWMAGVWAETIATFMSLGPAARFNNNWTQLPQEAVQAVQSLCLAVVTSQQPSAGLVETFVAACQQAKLAAE